MSSGDAMAHAAASIAVRDGCVGALRMPWDEHRQRGLIRIGVVLVMLASYALAMTYRGDLVSLLLWAYGPVGQFAPAVVATLYWRRATGAGVAAGLIAGTAVVTIGSAFSGVLPWPEVHAGAYGLAVNVVCLVAVSLLGRPGGGDEFLQVAGTSRSASD